MKTKVLDNLYKIECDKYNYTLIYKEKTEDLNKKGKKVIKTDQWYYPTLKDCLKKYLNEVLKPTDFSKDIYQKILEVEQKIDKL